MGEPNGAKEVVGISLLALCGESLLIEGIEASLKDREGVEIVRLNTSRPFGGQILEKLNPDVIVFDLTPSQLSCVANFLRTRTDVILIGLDIEHDLALFLSGEWRKLPTVADLMDVIEARTQIKNGRQL